MSDAAVESLYRAVEPIARAGGDWRRAAVIDQAARAIGDPQAFLAWAREHRRWRFAVAEAAEEVCAKPPEAAVHVAVKIVEELLEERGVVRD